MKRYQDWQQGRGRSVNTIAVHMRYIRLFFNDAIKKGIISADLYPFRNFQIKSEKTRKSSLTIEDIRRIRSLDLERSIRMARDLFMLSFFMNGINFKDLLLAKNDQVCRGKYNFNRTKTGRSYSILIQPEAREIINRYRGEKHLLNILERKVPGSRKTELYRDVTDYTNRKLKTVA